MNTIKALGNAELATVLAALRYWQREGLMSGGHEHDIATGGGILEPLTAEKIDALCERLNTPDDAGIAIILEGGIVQCVVTDKGLEGLPYDVIDYDTDGGDEADFYGIPQEDGSISTAYVSGGLVSTAAINLGGIKPLSEFDDEDQSGEG